MGSGTVIYVQCFIRIGSGVQKLIVGTHTHTHTYIQTHGQIRDLIRLPYFFQNEKSGLKKVGL
jgi:hypothetical protein